jgi:hypothetical protein
MKRSYRRLLSITMLVDNHCDCVSSLPAAVEELYSRFENVWFEEAAREVTADAELRPVGKGPP